MAPRPWPRRFRSVWAISSVSRATVRACSAKPADWHAAGTHLVPEFFGGRQYIAQATQCGILRQGHADPRPGQATARASRRSPAPAKPHCSGRNGLGNVIKGLAHQAFGETVRTFEQAANLQVDTGADLLDRPIGTDRGILQGFDESLCRPPERTGRRDSWVASMPASASSISPAPLSASAGLVSQRSRPF
jgi:hypothetical protein